MSVFVYVLCAYMHACLCVRVYVSYLHSLGQSKLFFFAKYVPRDIFNSAKKFSFQISE